MTDTPFSPARFIPVAKGKLALEEFSDDSSSATQGSAVDTDGVHLETHGIDGQTMIDTAVCTDFWPDVSELANPDARWWVLRTRSRQEKAVAAELGSRRVPHFMPLVTAERYHGRRKQKVQLPLFPGYVFLHGERDATYEIDRSRRIAGIVPVDDFQQPELHLELENLRKALELQAGFDPYPYLRHGQWAEVTSGPYRGLRGRIDRKADPSKLILQVDLLQSAMAIELDGAMLEVVSSQ